MPKLDFKVVTLFFLIIFDFIFTYVGIQGLYYEEANLLIADMFDYRFASALFIKIVYTITLLFTFSILRDSWTKLSNIAFNITFAAFMAVNAFHIYALLIT